MLVYRMADGSAARAWLRACRAARAPLPSHPSHAGEPRPSHVRASSAEQGAATRGESPFVACRLGSPIFHPAGWVSRVGTVNHGGYGRGAVLLEFVREQRQAR